MSARKTQSKAAVARVKEAAEVASEWLSLFALALAGFALLLVTTVGLSAQQFQSQAEYREAALRMHRERIAAMMEERRQEREGGAQEEESRVEQTQGSTATTSSQVTVRGSAQLMVRPLNIACHVGESFLTSVTLHNTAATEVDEITVCLRYDPQVLRPLQISDHAVRELLASPPELDANLETGVIVYSGLFARPHSGVQIDLITIEWESIVPTPRTSIALTLGGGVTSEVLRDGRDVLGEAGNPDDGTLAAQVAVRPLNDDRLRGALLINDLDSLRAVQGMEPQGGVTLSLVPQVDRIAVGETFAVDVRLANPEGSAIDDVRFALRYDPAVLEVLDAAPSEHRRPGDNWIVGGINLHDAPFQESYPFDFHLRNEALNSAGLADYRMGLSRARPLPDGTIARIYLRALAPVTETAIHFVHGDDPRMPTTMVRCLGVDVLGAIGAPRDGTRDLRLRVESPAMTASVDSPPPLPAPTDPPSGG